MFARLIGKTTLLALLALLLTGCFREASPGLAPTTIPTRLPVSPTQQPFVTPFEPGQGPDTTAMPTVPGTSPTVAFVTPSIETDSAGDATAASPPTSVPGVIATPPFAAGPTFTLNPNIPTPTPGQGILSTPTQLPLDPVISGRSDDGCTYTVEAGDTAFYIATINGITLIRLMEANEIENADYLFEGQVLNIPGCGEDAPSEEATPQETTEESETGSEPGPTTPPVINAAGQTIHTVQAGENLFRIALNYGVTVADIVAANGFPSDSVILSIGQELIVPTGEE